MVAPEPLQRLVYTEHLRRRAAALGGLGLFLAGLLLATGLGMLVLVLLLLGVCAGLGWFAWARISRRRAPATPLRRAAELNAHGVRLGREGKTDAAVERFEESLEILRRHPDDRHQAKVMANLGLMLLKHGDEERARGLLADALEKLPPESPAARRVETELRRAS